MGISETSITSRCENAFDQEAAEEVGAVMRGRELEALSPKARDVVWLIELYRENERLLARQRRLKDQIGELMTYWHREDANRDLAWARLVQLRVKHQGVRAQLKANQALTVEILTRNGEDGRDDRAAS